jgi:hypothetical protein
MKTTNGNRLTQLVDSDINVSMKYCPHCQTSKLLTDFSKNKSRKDGLMGYCKPCQQEKRKISDQKYKEDRNASARQWRSENRDAHLATLKRYRNKRQSVRTALQVKRKAAKLQRTPAWLTDFDLLHIQCLYQVAAMRTRESGYEWHVDHVIPLQGKTVSGLHVPNNLRVIPATENIQKSNNY